LTKRSELFDDSSDISNDGSSNNHASSDIAIHNDFSLKPEIKKALTPINQIIDKENFELTNTFVAEIYSKQEELLLEKKAEKEALRINTLKKVDALKKTLELKHIDQNSLKSVINDIENSLLELKEDSKYFETSDKRKKATKFILLAFISIVLGYGLPAIFGHFLSSTMISVFHYAFYGVATIFGFFGMSYILSILTIKANKQKLEWIRIKTRSHILRLEEIKKEIIKNNELIAAIEQDIVTNNAFADSLIDVANSMNVIQSENTQSKTN
jgi:hypothetical protein